MLRRLVGSLSLLALASACPQDDPLVYRDASSRDGASIPQPDAGNADQGPLPSDAATESCVAQSCIALGAECGSVPDGCGGTLDCGTCAAPQTCGGGGTPNVCGCLPLCTGKVCGTDGCGGACGACSAGQQCADGACKIIAAAPAWGLIANSLFQLQKVATTLYFPGDPRNPALHTANPLPAEANLSTNNVVDDAQLTTQIKRMKRIGINAVEISYFGQTETDGGQYLPVKPNPDVPTVYTAVVQKIQAEQMLFFPLIEVSDKFPFWSEFPQTTSNLIDRISFWSSRFSQSTSWLQLYDKNGQPKKVVALIEAIKLSPYDATAYVNGLAQVAAAIKTAHGIDIGFAIDPTRLPADDGTPFGPTPGELATSAHVLAILPWDITVDGTTDAQRLQNAKNTLSAWSAFPVISFTIPGYDAHIVFPWSTAYGKTDAWRADQKQLAAPAYGSAGVSVGPWNGWTEYFHVTCSVTEGAKNLKWGKEIIDVNNDSPSDTAGISCP